VLDSGGASGDALSRIADAVRDAVPFARPEVVRSDEGRGEGVRIQVGPDQYLLLMHVDGQWTCGDVYINAETGEPDTSPSVRRLMRESNRLLPVSDPEDLSDVVHRFLRRAITGWSVTAGHAFVTEHDRQFAVEALSRLDSRLLEHRPPVNP
jgi:hypothetical protein